MTRNSKTNQGYSVGEDEVFLGPPTQESKDGCQDRAVRVHRVQDLPGAREEERRQGRQDDVLPHRQGGVSSGGALAVVF